MIWISKFFFCIGTMTITGGIVSVVYLLLRRRLERAKEGLALHILKINVLLYLLPLVYLLIFNERIQVAVGFSVSQGQFGVSLRPGYDKVFFIVGIGWIAGLLAVVFWRLHHMSRLIALLCLNMPVTDIRWKRILYEECAKYRLKQVRIYQNEALTSPIATNILRPMIVVPPMRISEQQMRMIVEHEVHHILRRDLLWRRIALWMSWLHWFNPLVYFQENWLCMEQELACDAFVCEHTRHYTAKEYFQFMLSIVDEEKNSVFFSTLFDTRKNIMRRIETMKERKMRGRATKRMLMTCTVILMMVSAIPTYALAESVVAAEDEYLSVTEVMFSDSGTTTGELTELCFTDDESVDEVIVESGVNPYSSLVVIDLTAEPLTRYSYKMQSMVVGDQVAISVQCSDPDALFWIGVKNVYTNEGRYVQGTNILQHTFTITEAGTYRVFVENRSTSEVEFLGSAIYPN